MLKTLPSLYNLYIDTYFKQWHIYILHIAIIWVMFKKTQSFSIDLILLSNKFQIKGTL